MQEIYLTNDGDVMKGLMKDPQSGDYRVEEGYGYQANRYRIDDSWLDEEDNIWIKGDAVERATRQSQDQEQAQ